MGQNIREGRVAEWGPLGISPPSFGEKRLTQAAVARPCPQCCVTSHRLLSLSGPPIPPQLVEGVASRSALTVCSALQNLTLFSSHGAHSEVTGPGAVKVQVRITGTPWVAPRPALPSSWSQSLSFLLTSSPCTPPLHRHPTTSACTPLGHCSTFLLLDDRGGSLEALGSYTAGQGIKDLFPDTPRFCSLGSFLHLFL